MNEVVDFLREMRDFSWITPFLFVAFPPISKRLFKALKALQAWTKAVEEHSIAISNNTTAIKGLTQELRDHSIDGHGGKKL